MRSLTLAFDSALEHAFCAAYRVRWSVVSRDGHQTEGDYPFTME
ncbi:MAG: copper resistance protein CopC [Gammaproteobacteria bacterium]